MSRKYNTAARMLKAYQNYVQTFEKRVTKLLQRGYEPIAPDMLSFEEFKGNRAYLAKMGVAPGNITRTIVSRQLYQFNQAQAEDMMMALKELGIIDDKDRTLYGYRVTIESLRSKGGLGDEALSMINDTLKQRGLTGSERAAWITEHIYEDSL